MSALIKRGATHGVLPLALHGKAAPLARAPGRPDPAALELAALRAEIADLRQSHAQAEHDAEATAAEAFAEGRRIGLAEAESLESERTQALRHGIEAAVAGFDRKLDVLDGLAPLLARRGLEKIFAAPDEAAERIKTMLLRQLRELRDGGATGVRVSPADFPSPDGLRLWADEHCAGTDVTIDPHLAAGACRIELRLGRIDLCVAEQWSALAALLDEMAAARP
jgi:type III secretion protein L